MPANVICNSVESDRSNVFDTYNVTVSGSTSYTLTFDPTEYGPTNRLPVGTNEVTVTAYPTSSPSTAIGSCTFNVTVSLQELPIACPASVDLIIGTDSGEPFYTYQDPQFNVTYPPDIPESMMYVPYGSITMMRTYDGSSSSPRLAISPSAHTVTVTITDGTLSKSCPEARVTVEDREPPVIVCADDVYQDHILVDAAFYLKSISDNSGRPFDVFFLPAISQEASYPVGTTTYTFTIIDRAGNNASCSLNVTVEIDVTCNSVESDRSNVFDTYNVTVSGSTSYTFTFDPAEYGPTNRLPVGTNEVTVTAYPVSSPSTAIGSCTFNVTVSLQELPIACPASVDLIIGTDSGEPFYTYQDPQFNVTYPPDIPESMTYVPYGSIKMMRTYDGSSSSPRLAISPSAHTVTITISDGTLSQSCTEARVTVEDREPPVIVCPDDIYQDYTSVDFAFQLKSISDNSGEPLDLFFLPFISPGGSYPVGTTTYTFIVSDRAGNDASCSFNVTIEIDSTSPSTEGPQTPTSPGKNSLHTFMHACTAFALYVSLQLTH
ncbi:hyalin-like [Strongylocentrotus purpuratus]|uniref:HYR domain-containing protein n=1 Tax=Strongylocentrotus purpuratus TaxID=7668 RepID=A0A7M7PE45_STRPU|nr:hyalin-like [Strongylocentrotus purpuratus]